MAEQIKAKDAVPGRWYYDQQYGFRLLCTHNHPPSQPAFVVNNAGAVYRDLEHRLTPLPDCTGWDWEPAPKHPPVPEGWRELIRDEVVAAGDKLPHRGQWHDVIADIGVEQRLFDYPHIRRIEPTYRPFASAEEFDPHADRVVVNIGTGTRRRIDHWSDKGCMGMSWGMAFRKYTFLDGSPFGVEVKE